MIDVLPYVREYYPEVAQSYLKAKELAFTDQKYFIIEIGILAEQVVSRACAHAGVEAATHFERLRALEEYGLLEERYAKSFHAIRVIRNDVMHGNGQPFLDNSAVNEYIGESVNTLRWFGWIMQQDVTVPKPAPRFPKISEFLVWDAVSNFKTDIVIVIAAMLLWRWLNLLFGDLIGGVLMLVAIIPVFIWREKKRMWFYKGWLERHGKKAALILGAIIAAFVIDRMITSGVFIPVMVLAVVAFAALKNRKKSGD